MEIASKRVPVIMYANTDRRRRAAIKKNQENITKQIRLTVTRRYTLPQNIIVRMNTGNNKHYQLRAKVKSVAI